MKKIKIKDWNIYEMKSNTKDEISILITQPIKLKEKIESSKKYAWNRFKKACWMYHNLLDMRKKWAPTLAITCGICGYTLEIRSIKDFPNKTTKCKCWKKNTCKMDI